MARTTYADRLKALIANPAMSARDCQFANSLLSYYVKRKSLTSGRARCVRELEARYSAEAVAEREKTTAPLRGRLQALTARVTEGSWAGGFVESLTEQVASGRNLSPRQIEILEKIESEHSDEAINAAATWEANFSDDMRDRLTVAARYYRRNGYFTNLVDRALTPDGQPTAFLPIGSATMITIEERHIKKARGV